MRSAVLMDLYNTLVPGGNAGRDAMVRAMGADLGVDPAAFAALARETWYERMTGIYGDLSAETAALAARLGVTPSPAALATAVERRMAFTRSHLVPPAASLETARTLRANGWRLVIVSNCTFDSSAALRRTALADVVHDLVLSCDVHLGKPDPGIYRIAVGDLDPTDCVYIGDGADNELVGAAALGMRVIQTCEYVAAHPGWTGEQISSIADLVDLV